MTIKEHDHSFYLGKKEGRPLLSDFSITLLSLATNTKWSRGEKCMDLRCQATMIYPENSESLKNDQWETFEGECGQALVVNWEIITDRF